MTPNIQNTYSELACQTAYPDLTREQCQTWADDLGRNHPQDVSSCTISANSGTPGGGTEQVREYIQCLEAKGLGPKSK